VKFLLNVYLDAGDQATPTGRSHAGVVNDEAVADVLRRSGELVDAQSARRPVHDRGGTGPERRAADHQWSVPLGRVHDGLLRTGLREPGAAMELAARHPAAHSTVVEVRPLMTPAGLEGEPTKCRSRGDEMPRSACGRFTARD
jgi:hypothetical protein